MAASSYPASPSPPLTKTSSVRLVDGGVSVESALRAQGGFTVYKTLFKIKAQSSEGVPIIQQCVIWKRFSDFQQLSKQLELLHAHSKSLSKPPVLVKAKYFERFKESVIEERRRSAESLLQFASRYHHLASSPVLQQFLAGSTTVGVADPSPAPQQQQQQQQQPPVLLQRNPSLLLEVGAVDLPQPLQSEEETLSVGTSLPNAAAQFDQTDSAQPAVAPMDPRNRLEVEQSSVHKLKVPTLSKQLTGSDLSSNNTSATGSEENLASGSNVSLEISDLPEGLKASSGDEHSKKVSTSSNPSSTVAKSSGEGGGGIGWWAEAMAETQDFDALIEKMDSENTNGNSNTDKQSLPESLDLDSPGQPAPPPQRLKQAKSDSSLSSPDAAVGGGERNLSHGHSETSVRRRSGSTGGSKVPSPQQRLSPVQSASSAYVLQAGKLIKQALAYEGSGEYEEAFDLFKAGVDVLLNGVQTDHNKRRREIVRKKTSEYLQHAEQLFQEQLAVKHKDSKPVASESSQPLAATAKPHLLPDFKVLGTIDKVMLVESKLKPGQTYVFKVLYKSLMIMAAVKKGRSKASKNRSLSQCPHMVKLLHHYETANHRLFLLLEHMKNGRLIDFVQAKRDQWNKLKAAAENPPPSSLLVSKTLTAGADSNRKQLSVEDPLEDKSQDPEAENIQLPDQKPHSIDPEATLTDSKVKGIETRTSDEEKEDEMERLLSELTSIVPPSKLPSSITSEDSQVAHSPQSNGDGGEGSDGGSSDSGDGGRGSEDGDGEPNNSVLDSLAILRKRFEETIETKQSVTDAHSQLESSTESKSSRDHDMSSTSSSEDAGTEKTKVPETEAEAESATAINILPPTPTVSTHTPVLGNTLTGAVETATEDVPQNNTLSAKHVRINQSLDSTDDVEQLPAFSDDPVDPSPSIAIPGRAGGREEREGSPGGHTSSPSPHFSPGSLRNSPDPSNKVDEWVRRLECSTRQWAAQITVALEHLHYHNVVWRDFNKNNVLLDDSGNAVLTYFGKWDFVPSKEKFDLAEQLYVAPELCGLAETSEASDWWSLGALLFEILTGESLASCHPDGLHTHLPLRFPILLSPEAQSLLTQLLQVNPTERLGCGSTGVEELKAHPFFSDINWNYT